MTKRAAPTDTETAEPSGSRATRTSVELFGLSREELAAMGPERFQELLNEAIDREVAQKMVPFDAALASARAMIADGRSDAALGLLRSAAAALADDGLQARRVSQRFVRMLFGPRSERLDGEELQQLFFAFEGKPEAYDDAIAAGTTPTVPTPEPISSPVGPDEDEPAADDAEPSKGKKKRPNHKGRRPLAATCAVVETMSSVAAEERVCGLCGAEKSCIHKVRHERIEFEPARLVIHCEVREVLACIPCRKDVVTAPRTDAQPSKRRVANSVVADLIVEKCSEAQPLHRERERYRRLGWEAPLSTLDSAWRWGTDLLVPIADVVRGEILIDDYIRADSTPLTILDAKHPSGRFKGQVWAFVAGGHVAFEFTKSWSADEIADSFLLLPNGYKQVDDYAGYGSEVTRNGVKLPLVRDDRRLGCGMHIRRRFVAAFEARDLRASIPLEHFRRIYEIEAEAKTNKLTDDARLALRRERSQPILSQLREWLDKQLGALPPKSLLGGAVGYANQQWTYFERCFTRGDFEIDNGAPEREIRTIAIGRRNFLFSGSVDAAKRLCAAYTLVVGAKRVGVDPFVYVKDVLDKLASGWKINRVAELTPRRWAAAQAPK